MRSTALCTCISSRYVCTQTRTFECRASLPWLSLHSCPRRCRSPFHCLPNTSLSGLWALIQFNKTIFSNCYRSTFTWVFVWPSYFPLIFFYRWSLWVVDVSCPDSFSLQCKVQMFMFWGVSSRRHENQLGEGRDPLHDHWSICSVVNFGRILVVKVNGLNQFNSHKRVMQLTLEL